MQPMMNNPSDDRIKKRAREHGERIAEVYAVFARCEVHTTMFTILPGTTMIFFGIAPASASMTFSC